MIKPLSGSRIYVLVYWDDVPSSDADVTVKMPRKTLKQLVLNPSVTPVDVTVTGDSGIFDEFALMLDVFDLGFNMVLP